MEPKNISIIPAKNNYFAVYDMEDKVEVTDQIIAWRIETYFEPKDSTCSSSSFPLTVDGEVLSNCIGVQNPDKTITVFDDSIYQTLEELNKARYPSK